jgi:hypothetical protein
MSRDVEDVFERDTCQDMPVSGAELKPRFVYAKILFSTDTKEALVKYINEFKIDPEGVIIKNPNIVKPKLSF